MITLGRLIGAILAPRIASGGSHVCRLQPLERQEWLGLIMRVIQDSQNKSILYNLYVTHSEISVPSSASSLLVLLTLYHKSCLPPKKALLYINMPRCGSIALQLLWAVTLVCFISGLPSISQAIVPHVATRRETSVVNCLNSKGIPVLTSTDAQYAKYSSPYNIRLHYNPLVIALAVTSKQVSDSVLCAAKYNLKVQAKSGGHSYASYSTGGRDGSVIIDLQKFQNVTFDITSKIATFGPGVRLGNLELALRPYGRALPHGTCAGVGAGGHFTTGTKEIKSLTLIRKELFACRNMLTI